MQCMGYVYRLAAILCISLPWVLAQSASGTSSWETQRLERMKFDQIARELRAGEGRRIADLGAGQGAFSAALARLTGPQGIVYAVDIDEQALKALEKRKRDGALVNLEVIHATEDDPRLPREALDAVLLVDTYH